MLVALHDAITEDQELSYDEIVDAMEAYLNPLIWLDFVLDLSKHPEVDFGV